MKEKKSGRQRHLICHLGVAGNVLVNIHLFFGAAGYNRGVRLTVVTPPAPPHSGTSRSPSSAAPRSAAWTRPFEMNEPRVGPRGGHGTRASAPSTGPPPAPEPLAVQASAWKAWRFLPSLTCDHCPPLSAQLGDQGQHRSGVTGGCRRERWSHPRPCPRTDTIILRTGLLLGAPQGGPRRRLQRRGLRLA